MLSILKHPLFKRELSQIRWTTLLLIIAILLPILVSINHIEITGNEYSWRPETIEFISTPYDMFGWLVLPIIVISQFFYTRKESVNGLLASLPYDRKTQLTYKYLAGVLCIACAYFIGFLVVTSTYFSAGTPILGPFSPLIVWYLVVTASAIMHYSFLFFIATVMGNSIFAGVGGFFIFYAPAFITMSILFNLDMFFNINVSDIEQIFQFMTPHYIMYTGSWYNKTNILLMDFMPMLVLYTIFSCILFKLAEKAFDKNNFEYNGNMCMFVWAENVFLAGFTLCFGFLGLDFAQIFQYGWLYPIAVIAGLACFPFGYILGRKLLSITGHQLQLKKS